MTYFDLVTSQAILHAQEDRGNVIKVNVSSKGFPMTDEYCNKYFRKQTNKLQEWELTAGSVSPDISSSKRDYVKVRDGIKEESMAGVSNPF